MNNNSSPSEPIDSLDDILYGIAEECGVINYDISKAKAAIKDLFSPKGGDTSLQELKERLAAIEHERWADWQKWCHKILREQLGNQNGSLEAVLERWERQIATPYSELSDEEKASDMEQVDRYWPLLLPLFSRESREAEIRIDELKWADDKFDSLLQATEDGDRVNPGEYFEAIEARIKELESTKLREDK